MKLNKLSKAQEFGLNIWFGTMSFSAIVACILPFAYELLCDAQGLSGLITMMVTIPVCTLLAGAFIGIVPFMVFTLIRVVFVGR